MTEQERLADGHDRDGSRPSLRDRLEIGRGGDERLASMEGLRGLAVLLVFFVHYSDVVSPWMSSTGWISAVVERIEDAGNSGVDLFFVLSGFLIYGNLMKRAQAYRPFIRRRVRRLYPTFLAVFVMYIGLSFAVPSESELPGRLIEVPAYLLFNALLLPGIIPVSAFITVAWTLSYEFFFYLTVPVLISRMGMRERSPEWRWRFLMRFGIAVLLLGGLVSGTHPRLSMFFGGMLLWEWMTYRWPSRSGDSGARSKLDRVSLLALAVGVLSPLFLSSSFLLQLPRIAVLLVAWPVLCAGCFAIRGTCSRWFSWTPIRLLGNVSYSYYLVHALVLQAAFFALELIWEPTGDASWLWFAALVPVFVLTVVGAVVLFLVVEKPFSLDSRTLRLIGRSGRS